MLRVLAVATGARQRQLRDEFIAAQRKPFRQVAYRLCRALGVSAPLHQDDVEQVIDHMAYGTEGIYGIPLYVYATQMPDLEGTHISRATTDGSAPSIPAATISVSYGTVEQSRITRRFSQNFATWPPTPSPSTRCSAATRSSR